MDDMHAGPIMDKVPGFARHCETVMENHKCPYIPMGCLGCTLKRPAFDTRRIQDAFERTRGMTPDEIALSVREMIAVQQERRKSEVG